MRLPLSGRISVDGEAMDVLSRKVLLLSAHCEPLGVIGVVRAFNLVRKNKARMERIDDSCAIRTSTHSFPVPSVISLVKYVNIRKRRRESGKQRFRIFVRDHFKCQYCCKRFSPADLTLDHIIPRSQDGTDDPENLAAACIPCNQRKGNRTPDEARMPLLATPSALRYGLDRAMLAHYAETRPDWLPFLCLEAKVA